LHGNANATGLVVDSTHELTTAATVFSGHHADQLLHRVPIAARNTLTIGDAQHTANNRAHEAADAIIGDAQHTANDRAHEAADAILTAILLCPTDSRRPVAKNVILCASPLLSARVSTSSVSVNLPGRIHDSCAFYALPQVAELAFSGISRGAVVPVGSLGWLAGAIMQSITHSPSPSLLGYPPSPSPPLA